MARFYAALAVASVPALAAFCVFSGLSWWLPPEWQGHAWRVVGLAGASAGTLCMLGLAPLLLLPFLPDRGR